MSEKGLPTGFDIKPRPVELTAVELRILYNCVLASLRADGTYAEPLAGITRPALMSLHAKLAHMIRAS
jgi:hypothetical protein